jgi:hypothetical protein
MNDKVIMVQVSSILTITTMIIICKKCGKDLTSQALILLENLNGNKKWTHNLKCCSESTTKNKVNEL